MQYKKTYLTILAGIALVGTMTHHKVQISIYPEDWSAKLWPQQSQAIMVGTINESTLETFEDFLDEYPETRTLVMYRVPGSDDDDTLFEVGELIRKHHLNTLVPHNGEIASGGPELFLAGVKRMVEPGGKVGVHTWWEEDTGIEGRNLDKNHKEHQPYLNYYQNMGLSPSEAEALYFFILNAAGPDDLYWLTEKEMKEFKLTQYESSL